MGGPESAWGGRSCGDCRSGGRRNHCEHRGSAEALLGCPVLGGTPTLGVLSDCSESSPNFHCRHYHYHYLLSLSLHRSSASTFHTFFELLFTEKIQERFLKRERERWAWQLTMESKNCRQPDFPPFFAQFHSHNYVGDRDTKLSFISSFFFKVMKFQSQLSIKKNCNYTYHFDVK